MSLKLECTFTLDGVSAKAVWLTLSSARSDVLKPDLLCDLNGNAIKVRDVASAIETRGKPHFTVECEAGIYHFAPLGSYDQSFLQISGSISSVKDAEEWIAPFLSYPEFLQARLYDEKYEFWQNAKDPLQYEVRKRTYDHLPKKSNGLPPPLEQLEIDISNNPGRRIIRVGFIEAVGALMWLSPEFMNRVGLSADDVRSEPWLDVQDLTSGTLKIQAQDKVFTAGDGDEGARQNGLRDLLFRSKNGPCKTGRAF